MGWPIKSQFCYLKAVSDFDGQVNKLIRQDSVIYLDQSLMAKNTFDKIPPSLSYKQPISNSLFRLIYEPKNLVKLTCPASNDNNW